MALKQLKAFTLLESVISMAIIVTIFVFFAMTITNITSGSSAFESTRLLLESKRISEEARQKKEFIDGEESVEGISYHSTFTRSEYSDNLLSLTIVASDTSGKKLFEYNELLLNEE